jgi:hypothetical protein
MAVTLNASTSSGFIATSDTSGVLELQSSGTTAVTLTTAQNVGIGTTSPTVYGSYRTLEVRGTGGGLLQIGTGASTAAYLFQDGTNSGFNNISNGVMTFGTNNTERMRITSGGEFLVGRTTASFGNTGVAVYPAGLMFIENANSDALSIRRSSGGVQIAFYTGSATLAGTISSSGSSTSYNTSSDYRLKENIAPMAGALTKIAQLKPCTYTWKTDGSDGQGFIAHELQEVFPDAVTGEKDAVNEDGSIKPQGIDTSFLVATLTAAIQEQQAQIEELKAEVKALKGAQ